VHLLGARRPQRSGALVDGGSGCIDVVEQRQRARSAARGEGVADVAPASGRIQSALGAHGAGTAEQRHDRDAPPAREPCCELRGRVGAAQEQAIADRRHDCQRIDRRTRELVRDQRGQHAPGGDLAALPARHDVDERPVEPQRGARGREPAQLRACTARGDRDRRRGSATRAQGRREGAQPLAACIAHPVARCAARHAATRQQQADERGGRRHGARLGPGAVTCLSRRAPEKLRLPAPAGSPRTAPCGLRPRSRSP
jgi:hypothetical protein